MLLCFVQIKANKTPKASGFWATAQNSLCLLNTSSCLNFKWIHTVDIYNPRQFSLSHISTVWILSEWIFLEMHLLWTHLFKASFTYIKFCKKYFKEHFKNIELLIILNHPFDSILCFLFRLQIYLSFYFPGLSVNFLLPFVFQCKIINKSIILIHPFQVCSILLTMLFLPAELRDFLLAELKYRVLFVRLIAFHRWNFCCLHSE